MRVVILGLSITSSWGNGHATTFRCLVRGLSERGHDVLFLERDVPWYAGNRDLPNPPWGRTELYTSLRELKDRFAGEVRDADLVVVGSYVPDGVQAGEWVLEKAGGLTAFYDIDTPVTLSKLERGENEYLSRTLLMRYDLYLSFTGGPTLERLEREFHAHTARVLYCSVDPDLYYPESTPALCDLGYLGTFSPDRQPALDALLMQPAASLPDKRFVVAGPLYPLEVQWPANVERIEHLPPSEHRRFYNSQRFTLNITRADMRRAGHSPSVRLFEAAACGTPVIGDSWPGLEEMFVPGREILVARTPEQVREILIGTTERERVEIGARFRQRVLREHTYRHRAEELERYVGVAVQT
jgi:spore maturation protein CgeB